MVSVLQTAMLHDGDVGKAMKWYPEQKGKEEDRVNKYWVMYGDTSNLQSRRCGSVTICVYISICMYVCTILS